MIDLALYGRYHPPQGLRNETDVRAAYASRGMDFDSVASRSRELTANFPFENLIPMGSWFSSGGAGFGFIAADGTFVEMEGPGVLTTSQYEASFERAADYIEVAASKGDSGPMLDALVTGVSSVEAYLYHRASIWNVQHQKDRLQEVPPRRISFDDKIRDWIPQMAGGAKLDLSGDVWATFKRLRAIRDDKQVHAKSVAFGFTDQEIASTANYFGVGIARLLRRMHLLFGEQIPPKILRSCYLPAVSVIEKT